LDLNTGIVGKVAVAVGSGSVWALGVNSARGYEGPGTDGAVFHLDQSGFVGGCLEAGAMGGCVKPLGPFGGSRAGSEPLGPVGITGGDGSHILISLSGSLTVEGSSLTFPFAESCESFDITVSGMDSAFAGVCVRLLLRLRLWCCDFRSASQSCRADLGRLETFDEKDCHSDSG